MKRGVSSEIGACSVTAAPSSVTVTAAAAAIDRRTALTVSISDGEVRLLAGDHSFVLAVTEHRLAPQG